MDRNSERVELFRQALNNTNKNPSIEEMVKDLDYLNMALNLALFETAYEEPVNIINIYGYPVIITDKSLFLVKPVINNTRFSTLEPTGRLVIITDEQLLDRFLFEAKTNCLLPKVIEIKIWNNLGFIPKEDEDFKRTRGIPFMNKIHFYKVRIIDIKTNQTNN